MAVVTVLVAVLAISLAVLWPTPLEERVRRIEPGMTEDEVDRLMGRPAGNYSDFALRGRANEDPDWRPKKWLWNHAILTVWFGADGRVKEKFL